MRPRDLTSPISEHAQPPRREQQGHDHHEMRLRNRVGTLRDVFGHGPAPSRPVAADAVGTTRQSSRPDTKPMAIFHAAACAACGRGRLGHAVFPVTVRTASLAKRLARLAQRGRVGGRARRRRHRLHPHSGQLANAARRRRARVRRATRILAPRAPAACSARAAGPARAGATGIEVGRGGDPGRRARPRLAQSPVSRLSAQAGRGPDAVVAMPGFPQSWGGPCSLACPVFRMSPAAPARPHGQRDQPQQAKRRSPPQLRTSPWTPGTPPQSSPPAPRGRDGRSGSRGHEVAAAAAWRCAHDRLPRPTTGGVALRSPGCRRARAHREAAHHAHCAAAPRPRFRHAARFREDLRTLVGRDRRAGSTCAAIAPSARARAPP